MAGRRVTARCRGENNCYCSRELLYAAVRGGEAGRPFVPVPGRCLTRGSAYIVAASHVTKLVLRMICI